MKYKVLLGIGLLVAFIAGAWALLRPPELPELGSEPVARAQVEDGIRLTTAVAPAKLSAASVLAIDPRASPKKTAVAPRPTLFTEYQAAKSYRALYDRLKSTSEGQTPEGAYVLYEILRKCATITDRTTRQPVVRSTEQKREEFITSIPANDPQRDKRIAAFDDIATNRCAGMDGATIAQADLNRLLANAAALGDSKAQALAIEQELWAERRASGPQGRWGRDVTVTDAQFESLQRIAASRDPEAMLIAGRVLANTWNDFALRIGPDNQAVENRALMQAWQLLACDYGYPCGESNPRVMSACAYQGHCNATSLADYMYYYGASPHDSQLVSQYREILRNAVETGNWSQLTVARGVPTTGPRFTFRQGP